MIELLIVLLVFIGSTTFVLFGLSGGFEKTFSRKKNQIKNKAVGNGTST